LHEKDVRSRSSDAQASPRKEGEKDAPEGLPVLPRRETGKRKDARRTAREKDVEARTYAVGLVTRSSAQNGAGGDEKRLHWGHLAKKIASCASGLDLVRERNEQSGTQGEKVLSLGEGGRWGYGVIGD